MRQALRTPRNSLRRGKAKQGNTYAGRDVVAEPRLPHERDESSDSQKTSNLESKDLVQQAFEDVEKGVVDTDKGPVLQDLARKKYPPK